MSGLYCCQGRKNFARIIVLSRVEEWKNGCRAYIDVKGGRMLPGL
jgi:hypothetical protein